MPEEDPTVPLSQDDIPTATAPPFEPDLQYLAYDHLPPHLQAVSKPFALLANEMMAILPRCHQRTRMIQKILEAKDCAVRAKVSK